MQKRTSRLVVALIILAAGIAGGFFVFDAHRVMTAERASSRDLSVRFDQLIATAGELASAQQAYLAPGQQTRSWLEQSTGATRRFSSDLALIRPRLRSTDAAPAIDLVDRAFKALVAVDGTVRADLQQDQSLLAADLIFSEGRDSFTMVVKGLQDLRIAEQTAADGRVDQAEQQQWAILGGVALLWSVGLVMLAFLSPTAASQAAGQPASSALSAGEQLATLRAGTGVDLGQAAAVCESLARTARSDALPDILARAAVVLDARGIVVWMGRGEQLFPALVHGYDARVVTHLGPLSRTAANPTAEAWRTGKILAVIADGTSHGALAVPMSSVSGCVGVLAAEVRHGRESDPATRAVASMFAAQLASIVSAWPAGSGVPPDRVADHDDVAVSQRA